MSKTFVFIAMIFCHIIDDFVLQAPSLSNLKQRIWWRDNAPERQYKNDYIVALFMHSFSWSFMVMLPIAFYYDLSVGCKFAIVLIVNAIIHALIDNLKANKFAINLVYDQLFHFIQIIVVYTYFIN